MPSATHCGSSLNIHVRNVAAKCTHQISLPFFFKPLKRSWIIPLPKDVWNPPMLPGKSTWSPPRLIPGGACDICIMHNALVQKISIPLPWWELGSNPPTPLEIPVLVHTFLQRFWLLDPLPLGISHDPFPVTLLGSVWIFPREGWVGWS